VDLGLKLNPKEFGSPARYLGFQRLPLDPCWRGTTSLFWKRQLPEIQQDFSHDVNPQSMSTSSKLSQTQSSVWFSSKYPKYSGFRWQMLQAVILSDSLLLSRTPKSTKAKSCRKPVNVPNVPSPSPLMWPNGPNQFSQIWRDIHPEQIWCLLLYVAILHQHRHQHVTTLPRSMYTVWLIEPQCLLKTIQFLRGWIMQNMVKS
jgi:hypothetical protein